tara:strand:+ start:410 stop:694 length:285 start_codon:yes stop_codon:yes gene_type:complete
MAERSSKKRSVDASYQVPARHGTRRNRTNGADDGKQRPWHWESILAGRDGNGERSKPNSSDFEEDRGLGTKLHYVWVGILDDEQKRTSHQLPTS